MYPPFGAGSFPNGSSASPRSIAGDCCGSIVSTGTSASGRPGMPKPNEGPSTGASAPPWKLPNWLRSWKSSSRPSLTPAWKPSTLSAPFGSTNSGLVNRLSTSVPVAFRQSANDARGAPSKKPTRPVPRKVRKKMLVSDSKPACESGATDTAKPFCAHRMLLRRRTFCDALSMRNASPVCSNSVLLASWRSFAPVTTRPAVPLS